MLCTTHFEILLSCLHTGLHVSFDRRNSVPEAEEVAQSNQDSTVLIFGEDNGRNPPFFETQPTLALFDVEFQMPSTSDTLYSRLLVGFESADELAIAANAILFDDCILEGDEVLTLRITSEDENALAVVDDSNQVVDVDTYTVTVRDDDSEIYDLVM